MCGNALTLTHLFISKHTIIFTATTLPFAPHTCIREKCQQSFSEHILFNSIEGITSTSMVQPWANIFIAGIETNIVNQSVIKPTVRKRYIDDILFLWDTGKHDIERFFEQANSYHPTIKFTAEISNAETTFLDTVAYKGN